MIPPTCTIARLLEEYLAVAEGPTSLDDLMHASPGVSGLDLSIVLGALVACGTVAHSGPHCEARSSRWWLTAKGYRTLGLERIVDREGVPC